MTPAEATKAMYDHASRGEWDAVEAFMAEDFVIHEPVTLLMAASGTAAMRCNACSSMS